MVMTIDDYGWIAESSLISIYDLYAKEIRYEERK